MKIRAVFFAFILISCVARSQDKFLIGWDYSGFSFDEFVLRTESQYPVKFFYDEEWTKGLTLGKFNGDKNLSQVLDTLFHGRSIFYYFTDGGNIVLTKNFAIRINKLRQPETLAYLPSFDYSEQSEQESPAVKQTVTIGDPSDRNLAGTITLSGYIRDQDTKQPVAGATIFIPKISAGTISNEYGYYKLSIPRGNYPVHYTFVGMKERTYDLNIFSNGEINVEMKTVLVPLKGAVITAEKDITLQRPEVGVEKINITSFRLMPSSLGETDVIKTFLLIPGVNTVGEGAAGFNVRGGSADQNLILLYGAPVYNSSHLFGFFSAINSDIINDVTLYKGGIPGRYGGRLSSVMDITPREGNRKSFAGNAGISPVTAHFVVEGPVIKDTMFYIISGRGTYSDWILNLIDDPYLSNSQAAFYDMNARMAWDINKKNKIELSAYYSFDGFRFNSDTTYKYQNNIFSLRWRHYFSSNFFSSFSINNSLYKYDVSSKRVPEESFNLTHRINSTGFKADFNWFAGRNDLNFGTDLIRYDVVPGDYMPAGDSSIVTPSSIQNQGAIEAAVYLEDQYAVTDFLTLNAGLRFSSFYAVGPQTVYNYDPNYTKSISSVTDTVIISNNDIYKKYAGPELRLSANFRLNRNSSFKLNYNRTIQYLHLLSNTAAISPTDTWKLSDYYTGPQKCDQYAAGYYYLFNNNKIELSAEVYYKKIDNMVDFKGGTSLFMNKDIERDIINVRGKAYGMEMMIKKPEGKIRWNVSYTYSRVLTRSKSAFADEMINGGNWFPANFDRPHDLIISFFYIHSRRVSITTSYNFASGRPVTYPVSSYSIGSIVLTNYSERNKYRVPYYSRLDLSVVIAGNLKIKKIAHPRWIFSIYNMTGRDNVYSAFFKYEKNKVNGYYLSVFDRPIPSLSFNFDF